VLININYTDVINKAERIGEIAQSIYNKSAKDVAAVDIGLNPVWKGDARTRYAKEMKETRTKIEKHAIKVQNKANELKKAAERLKCVEEYGKNLWG